VIEETAVVTRCDDDGFALVETERKSSCGSCSATGVCGTSALSKVFGNKRSVIKALNPIGVGPGDKVVVGLQESAMVNVSVMFYLVPIVAMIFSAIFAQSAAGWMGFSNVELFSILGGLLGLTGGLYLSRLFSERVRHDERYQAVILRRADKVKVEFTSGPVPPQ
jgi:sigma-E factor negative regulatory protein RseC